MIDSSYKENSDVQICLNVPNDRLNEELYLGFSLPVNKSFNNGKIWIPALDWMPGNNFKDPQYKLKKNGFGRNVKINRWYNIIAVSFYNSARFMIRNTSNRNVSIICESKFENK